MNKNPIEVIKDNFEETGIDIKIKVKYPDIDVFIFSDTFLPEAKEKEVDTALLKSHISKAVNDKNGVVFITGSFSQIPTGTRRFTMEDILVGTNQIAKIVNELDSLEEQYVQFEQIETDEKRDEFYLKASEQFKQFVTIKNYKPAYIDEMRSLPVNAEDNKVDVASKEFKKFYKVVQPLLSLQYAQENTKRYAKMYRAIKESGKLGGIFASNEEHKARNIGAWDHGEKIAEELGVPELYVPKNLSKVQFEFNSFLTRHTDQYLDMYIISSPTRSVEAAERLVNTITENDNGFDVLVLTGCTEFGLIHSERWFYDEKYDLYISRPQQIVLMPGYARRYEVNPVKRTSHIINTLNEEKLKCAIIPTDRLLSHPELLDRYGNINNSPDFKRVNLTTEEIKALRKDGKIVEFDNGFTNNKEIEKYKKSLEVLEIVDGIYKSPFEPSVDGIPIHGKSNLIEYAHRRNAPKSVEIKEQIVELQRIIDCDLYDIIRQKAGDNSEAIINAVKEFDHTNPVEVFKLFLAVKDNNKESKKEISNDKGLTLTKGGK